MKHMTSTAITLATLALATPLAAATENSGSASSAGATNQQTASVLCETGFLTSDSNGDGTISREEFDTSRERSFGAMDADGDGAISLEEYVGCLDQTASADGQSGTKDFDPDKVYPDLAEADTDGSGSIDAEEYMTATHDAHQQARADGGTDAVLVLRRFVLVPSGMSDQQVGAMSQEETASRAAQRFQAYDSDRSGDISDKEWSNAETTQSGMQEVLNTQFDEMDADMSGEISVDEYYKAGNQDWEAAQNAMNASTGTGSEVTRETESDVTASASDSVSPELDGTRGAGGDSTPPVVYFRYFAPLDLDAG
ncbi:MAG: hypothetical protein ACU0DK_17760 [Pseudooceanicola sp.]